MALARVVMMLRVVVIWKGDGESMRNQLEQDIHTYIYVGPNAHNTATFSHYYNYPAGPLILTRFLFESPNLPLSAPGRSPKDGSMNFAAASISVTFCKASPLTFQFLSPRSLTREEVIWGLGKE